VNWERVIEKRKCFGCKEFGYIMRNYRIKKEKKILYTIQNPYSSSADHTPFQSPINLRTKPYISHQPYRVLNNNFHST